MLHTLLESFAPPVVERLTLLVNHVLAGESVATARLRPHAGRRLELLFTAWPPLLPAPPVLGWRITPAGLLEWSGLQPDGAADLSLRLDAGNPAALAVGLLAGDPPPLQLEGDAQLAADIGWLTQNLRWDLAADLERLFGPAVAQQVHRTGSALAAALRTAVRGVQGLGERWRSRTGA